MQNFTTRMSEIK